MLYSFSANVFNTRYGPQFGVKTTIVICANNEKDAWEQANISFDKYIKSLYAHHNINGNGKPRKIINCFDYNDLKIE